MPVAASLSGTFFLILEMNSSHQGATMPKNIHKPRRSFSDLICWITIIAWCLVSISYTLFERLDQTGITTLWCLLPSFLFTNELAPNRSFTHFFSSPRTKKFFSLTHMATWLLAEVIPPTRATFFTVSKQWRVTLSPADEIAQSHNCFRPKS